MKEIPRETLERLFKKQKNQLRLSFVFSLVSIIFYMIYLRFAGEAAPLRGLFLLLLAGSVVYSIYVSKASLMSGTGGKVKEACRLLVNDYTSENAVNMLFKKMGEAKNYPEKVRLQMLIAEVYHFRGEANKALDMIYSIDRSGLGAYPDLGMTFFGDIIGIYTDLKDYDSVLRAYADGEQLIDRVCEKNYVCCCSALNIMISVEKARGNYRKALEMRLYRNEVENLFNSSIGASQQGTNLNVFIKGGIFLETAELFYLNGDYANAAKYVDIGAPMVAASPMYSGMAAKLSEDVRQALSKE